MNKLTIAAAASLIAFSTANIATAGDCDLIKNQVAPMSFDPDYTGSGGQAGRFTVIGSTQLEFKKASADLKRIVIRQADKVTNAGTVSTSSPLSGDVWLNDPSIARTPGLGTNWNDNVFKGQFDYSGTQVTGFGTNGTQQAVTVNYHPDNNGLTIELPSGATKVVVNLTGTVTLDAGQLAAMPAGNYRVTHEIQCSKQNGTPGGHSFQSPGSIDPDGIWTGSDKAVTYWGPGYTTVDPSCTFTNNENGIMDLDTATGVWTTRTSNPAKVSIDFVNIRRIDVDPLDDKIVEVNGPAEYPATINYGGSTADAAYTGAANPPKLTYPTQTNDNIGFTTIVNGAVVPSSGTIDFEIAGTATPTVSAIYKANTPYRVRHVITCTQ